MLLLRWKVLVGVSSGSGEWIWTSSVGELDMAGFEVSVTAREWQLPSGSPGRKAGKRYGVGWSGWEICGR